MHKEFKGVKITRRLQRYIGYAENKYKKLSLYGEVDLWEVLAEYKLIMDQPKCMQMFIYDLICGEFVHFGEYSVVRDIDGDIYVRKLNKHKVNM